MNDDRRATVTQTIRRYREVAAMSRHSAERNRDSLHRAAYLASAQRMDDLAEGMERAMHVLYAEPMTLPKIRIIREGAIQAV